MASTLQELTDLARTQLSDGVEREAVIGMLRENGLDKLTTVKVLSAALSTSPGEARLIVHHSAVWADHREADEYLQNLFFRGLFIECVVGNGQVNGPAEDVEECDRRQQRASVLLEEIAAGLPPETLTCYREHLAQGGYGRAFAVLVEVGRRQAMPAETWRQLAAVSETLCLDELLSETEPAANDPEYVHAAYLVRQINSTG